MVLLGFMSQRNCIAVLLICMLLHTTLLLSEMNTGNYQDQEQSTDEVICLPVETLSQSTDCTGLSEELCEQIILAEESSNTSVNELGELCYTVETEVIVINLDQDSTEDPSESLADISTDDIHGDFFESLEDLDEHVMKMVADLLGDLNLDEMQLASNINPGSSLGGGSGGSGSGSSGSGGQGFDPNQLLQMLGQSPYANRGSLYDQYLGNFANNLGTNGSNALNSVYKGGITAPPLQGNTQGLSKGVHKLPSNMVLGAKRMPDLTNVEVRQNAMNVVNKFPPEFQAGAIRLAKNLAARNIHLSQYNPVTVHSVSQGLSAHYNPFTGEVSVFNSISGSGGISNVSNSHGTALGSHQVGAIKHTGTGNPAGFGSSKTILGTNIEKLGLDIGNGNARGHGLASAMGNANAYSGQTPGGGSGGTRATSTHGVRDGRVPGGKTWGCIGGTQNDIAVIASNYLSARAKGHNSFEEVMM